MNAQPNTYLENYPTIEIEFLEIAKIRRADFETCKAAAEDWAAKRRDRFQAVQYKIYWSESQRGFFAFCVASGE